MKFFQRKHEAVEPAPERPELKIHLSVETLSDLTTQERQALTRLTFDEGFPVLVKVMNAICYEATVRAINTPPESKELVLTTHTEARLLHQFTSRFIGIIRHLNATQIQRANPQEESENGRTNGIYTRSSGAN